VRRTEGEELAEASVRLARILSADGDHARAVDGYRRAADAVPADSRFRPALLGAGRSLESLNRSGETLTVCRKVLPATATTRTPTGSVPDPELAGEAAHPSRHGKGAPSSERSGPSSGSATGRRRRRPIAGSSDRAPTPPALLAEARKALRPASDMSRRGR
jgi:hypothetical protein